MDISNLTGLEKPLTKLIEVTAKGIGELWAPKQILRIANAKAKAEEIRTESELRVNLMKSQQDHSLDPSERMEPTLAIRSDARVHYQQITAQENIENITRYAAIHLPPDVEEKAVDEDWIRRFFSTAQDICSSQMQEVWGKILAGEVAKPGQFSLRTLDAVRNISQKEAQIFQTACALLIQKQAILLGDKRPSELNKYGLSYGDILSLVDARLVLTPQATVQSFNFLKLAKGSGVFLLMMGDICLQGTRTLDEQLSLGVLELTTVGRELATLIPATHHHDHISSICELLAKRGCKVQWSKYEPSGKAQRFAWRDWPEHSDFS